MQKINFFENIVYDDEAAVVTDLLETDVAKEIRIVMQKHQTMCDRESDFPVFLEVLHGALHVSIDDNETSLIEGDLIVIEPGVIHHLEATEDSILRVTLIYVKDVLQSSQ
jgi:quercetin dioxygenase-like cupin family protein